nr:hypothetical protein [Tanacetum cinerariifolium]
EGWGRGVDFGGKGSLDVNAAFETIAGKSVSIDLRYAVLNEVNTAYKGVFLREEGDQAVSTPVQAPQPPLASRTMLQRLARLEEEVHRIKVSLGEKHEVMDAMARDLPSVIV